MRCDRALPLLPLLADRALGPLRRWMVSRHLTRCTDCAVQMEVVLTMQSALRTSLPYHRAPPELAARIGAALPREAPPTPVRSWHRAPSLRFAATGVAGALAGVALTLLVTSGAPNPSQGPLVAAVDSHIRSMMASHLTDVLTSDQHTVKPWLSARVDISPPVRDLTADGYPLIGGRLDYVDGHQAAVVVYRYARHIINLFAWASPGAADAGFRMGQRQGFNIVTWRQNSVTYCAVSDVEADKLSTFAHDVAK